MQISIDKIISFGPCDAWPRDRMLEVTGGREEFDTSELAWFEVPTEDLIWLTEQILKSLGNRDEYMLSASFAERVLPLYEREYPGKFLPRQAIRASRLYALCEIDESELDAARASARASARAAASDAAWYAARASARAAASDAAWYAASAADWASSRAYAAMAAASDAAWDAARAAKDAASAAAWYAARAAWAAELKKQREICAVFLKNI